MKREKQEYYRGPWSALVKGGKKRKKPAPDMNKEARRIIKRRNLGRTVLVLWDSAPTHQWLAVTKTGLLLEVTAIPAKRKAMAMSGMV